MRYSNWRLIWANSLLCWGSTSCYHTNTYKTYDDDADDDDGGGCGDNDDGEDGENGTDGRPAACRKTCGGTLMEPVIGCSSSLTGGSHG